MRSHPVRHTDDTYLGLDETLLRTLANDVYSAINDSGHL